MSPELWVHPNQNRKEQRVDLPRELGAARLLCSSSTHTGWPAHIFRVHIVHAVSLSGADFIPGTTLTEGSGLDNDFDNLKSQSEAVPCLTQHSPREALHVVNTLPKIKVLESLQWERYLERLSSASRSIGVQQHLVCACHCQ